MTPQTADLAATGQCQRTVGILDEQLFFDSVECLFGNCAIFLVYISFVHSFGISVHELGRDRSFRKIALPFRLDEHLIP